MEQKFLGISLGNVEEIRQRSSSSVALKLACERLHEVLVQLFMKILDKCFDNYPEESLDALKEHHIELHKILDCEPLDAELLAYLEQAIKGILLKYNWKDKINKTLTRQWRTLFNSLSITSPASFYPVIEDLVGKGISALNWLLINIDKNIKSVHLSINSVPEPNSFNELFKKISESLKEKTRKLNIQLKLCPGVEPPKIQRAQVETISTVKKHYTEWTHFSEKVEDDIEFRLQKDCSFRKCFQKAFGSRILSQISTAYYYAPVGWDIVRVNTEVIRGRYENIAVANVNIKENQVGVELEVKYREFDKERVWYEVKIEGTISRKRIKDVEVKIINEILVIIDDDGVHEIPEGVFASEDL